MNSQELLAVLEKARDALVEERDSEVFSHVTAAIEEVKRMAEPVDEPHEGRVIDIMIRGVKAWNDETVKEIFALFRPYLRTQSPTCETIKAERLR